MQKDFLNQTHFLPNWSPLRNQNARFDATLNPSGGYLNIVLKVKYVFPAFWRALNPGVSTGSFKKKMADMVDNVWSGRYQIAIKGNDDQRVVNVLPRVTLVEANGDQHFTINVQRLGSGRSYVEGNKCCFYSGAVNYKPSALAMKLGYKITFGTWGHDRLIYQQARKFAEQRINRTVTIEKDKEEPAAQTDAKQVADRLKENADVWPLMPLVVTGYRLAAEQPILSRRRAEKFVQRIKASGAPFTNFQIRDGGISREVKPSVKVEIGNGQSAFLERANNFPIAAHEIGHMLGLPDEYNAEDADAAMLNLSAKQYNIEPPSFDRNTQSLMSQGDKMLPYHYTTFLMAIAELAVRFRSENREVKNARPVISIVPALLRKSDPRVEDELSLSNLFA